MSDTKQQAKSSRRQVLTAVGVSGAAFLAGCYASNGGSNSAGLANKSAGLAKPVAPGTDNVLYLTFDDGPTPGYTNQILAHLKAAGAHATFFQVGERMVGSEALVNQILAEGHQIGTHSWSHPDFTGLGQPARTLAQFGVETQEQILRARDQQVACTGGYKSGLFRYPHFHRTNYGDLVLKQNGMIPVYADVAPRDYDLNVSDITIINEVATKVHGGSVVDLHDGSGAQPMQRPHPSYLPQLLVLLKAAGYRFGTLNVNDLPAAAITRTRQPE